MLASFSSEGTVSEQLRFATPETYELFLKVFGENYKKLQDDNFRAAAVAVPGRLNRKLGKALGYGTLPWKPAPIMVDLEKILNCPVMIENDAKLAGLSEAILIKNEFKVVLYVTIGTGIGTGIIVNGVIDPSFANSEGGQIWLDHNGERMQWEDFASGKAIVERFGKRASDIHDEKTWKIIAKDIASGLIDLIVTVQPDVIVLGGGVDTNYYDYISLLKDELKKYQTPLAPIPPIRKAKRPEGAVIYGCYEIAKAKYGHVS